MNAYTYNELCKILEFISIETIEWINMKTFVFDKDIFNHILMIVRNKNACKWDNNKKENKIHLYCF